MVSIPSVFSGATGIRRFVSPPVRSTPALTPAQLASPVRLSSRGAAGGTASVAAAPAPPAPTRITKIITVGGKRITLGGSPEEVARRETELRAQEVTRQASIERTKVVRAAEAAKAAVRRGETVTDIPLGSAEVVRRTIILPVAGVDPIKTEKTIAKIKEARIKGLEIAIKRVPTEGQIRRKEQEFLTRKEEIDRRFDALQRKADTGLISKEIIAAEEARIKQKVSQLNKEISKFNAELKAAELDIAIQVKKVKEVKAAEGFLTEVSPRLVKVTPTKPIPKTDLPILVGAGTVEEEKTRAAFGGVPEGGLGKEIVEELKGGRQEGEELFSFTGKGIFGKEQFTEFEKTDIGKGSRAVFGSAIGGPIGIVAPIFTRAGGFVQQFVPKEAKVDIPITPIFSAGLETTRGIPVIRGFTAPLKTEVREGVPTLALKAPEITELGILTAAIVLPKAAGVVVKKAAVLKGIDVTAIGRGTRRVSLAEPIEFAQRTKFDVTAKSLLGTEKITIGIKPEGTISKARVAETFAGELVEPIEAALIKKTAITGAPKISVTIPKKGAPIISKGFAEPAVVRGIGKRFIEQPRFLRAPKRISEPTGQTALVTPLKEFSVIREFPKGLKIREFRAGITPVTTGVGEGLLRFRQVARISELEKSIVGRTAVEAIGEFRTGKKAPKARVTVRETLRFIGEEPVKAEAAKPIRTGATPEQLRRGILKELQGDTTVTVQTKALQQFAKASQERAAKITPEVATKVTETAQAIFSKQAEGISKLTTRVSTQAAATGAVSLAPLVSAAATTTRRVTRPSVRVSQAPRIDTALLQLPSLRGAEAFSTAQLPRLAAPTATRTRAIESTAQISREISQFATRPALRSAVRTTAFTTGVGLARAVQLEGISIAPIVPTILFPLSARAVTKRKAKVKAKPTQGYNVFVKAKGKFKKARKKPLPRNLALAQGALIADNTTSRTFKIKKSKKKTKVRDISEPRLRKFRKGKRKDTFIEKTAFAIDSKGERAGIPFKGLATLRKNPELRISKKKRKAKQRAGLIDLAF